MSDFMTTDEVIEAIERERARLLAAVDAFGEHATTRAVTGEGWTAKDVLAHTIHWASQVAFALGARVEPAAYIRATEGRPTGDEWNALAVAFHSARSLADVRSDFDAVVTLIIERARLRTDDEMKATGAIPWASDRTLCAFIGGDTFLHWHSHSTALDRAAPG